MADSSEDERRRTETLSFSEAASIDISQIAKVAAVSVDLRDGFRNERRSPEYRAIHGLSPDVHDTHEDWVARLHPEDRARTVQHFLDAVNGTAEQFSYQYRIIRPSDGQLRWIATVARIERGPAREPLRLVGAHIDITDLAVAKEALRESEERFRLIANSAPVPMWVTKVDRSRAFANQAYLEFLGVPYEQALTFDWRTILHPDDADRIVKESVAGEATLKPFVLEGRYRRADGLWRWMRSESQPRWDPTGQHIGFIGVAHDVTVAKEAERELRLVNDTLEQRIAERTVQLQSNEAQMRAIFETSNQYQGLLDLQGNVVYANATALAGIRASAQDVTGKPFWDSPWFAATEGMREVVIDAFGAVVRGESVRTEMLLNLPTGERFFDFTMRPVFDQHGAVSGVLPEAMDITERRQAEEALRQSQKMDAVGQLTGGVAHDFNNLLTIIRSATDFLRRRELSEERRRRYIDAISDTVDRASKLTGQLLAFARRQPLTPQVFDVGSQVETIAQLIRPLMGGRIQIGVELGDFRYFATADVAQFEAALVNLAVNARDAMAGEGSLAISVNAVDAVPALRGHASRDGQFVAISVTDTGSGIAADKLDVIFEIKVTSTPARGSTFTIYLPQAESPAAGAEVAAVGAEASMSGRGHCVLVVEDNEDVGRFSTELLQDLGYAIKWAADAREALATLAEDEFAFDLVFSDVIMPGMNGVELATVIRERYPGLPVVLTSGYSSVLADNAHRGFELIQKPYSVEALSRTLRKAISERRPVE
jgi:PAS domain S-box-containing protein